MRLLLDECMPRALKFMFIKRGHECETVREIGFGGKTNGELLALAEGRFDVLITLDKSIPLQQNLQGRKISLLILRAQSNDISDLAPLVADAIVALQSLEPGRIVEIGQTV